MVYSSPSSFLPSLSLSLILTQLPEFPTGLKPSVPSLICGSLTYNQEVPRQRRQCEGVSVLYTQEVLATWSDCLDLSDSIFQIGTAIFQFRGSPHPKDRHLGVCHSLISTDFYDTQEILERIYLRKQ
jgi:hypothetical protein